jgi:hypothetical protein
MIDAAEIDRVLAGAAESMGTEHEWVRDSALTERAFALGVRAVLIQVAPPELHDAVERAAFRAVASTMFAREGDDSFQGTAAGRLIVSLQRQVDGSLSAGSGFDRLVSEISSLIDERRRQVAHRAEAACHLIQALGEAPPELRSSLVRDLEAHLRGLFGPVPNGGPSS